MKKTKRGVKQFFVMALTTMLVTESVFMPVSGKVNEGASAQTETVEQQISDNSVGDHEVETVSANFVLEKDNETSENSALAMNDGTSADQEAAEYSGTDGDLTWSIDADGLLTVTGKGDYEKDPDWLLHKKDIKAAYINVQEITTMTRFLYGCENLIEVDFADTDTSEVTDMSRMFCSCKNLEKIDLSHFDTGNVISVFLMFSGCRKIKELDLSHFDTRNVTDMEGMFDACCALEEVTFHEGATGNVTNMNGMFAGCQSLKELDLRSFDTGEVTDMGEMFRRCLNLKNLDISSFDTSNVTTMAGMFYGCENLKRLDVSSFDTSNVTTMANMFRECKSLESLDLQSFNTSNVKEMNKMFEECTSIRSLNVSSFDTGKVCSMKEMFRGMSSLELLDLKSFNIQNITDTSWMFWGCSSLEYLNVTSFNTENVTNMRGMFWDCRKLKAIDVSGFDTTNVTLIAAMFSGCSSLQSVDISGFDTSKICETDSMFANCSSLKEIDLNDFETQNVYSMTKMFEHCSSLKELDVSGLDTSNVTDMSYMFQGCSGLKELDVSELNTRNVTNMKYMFADCSGLEELKTPRYTGDVTDMSGLFCSCSKLSRVDISHFNTWKVEDYDAMFWNCTSLQEVDLSNFDTSNLRNMGVMFYNCDSLKSIDVGNFKVGDIGRCAAFVRDCDKLMSLTVSPDVMSVLVTHSLSIDFQGCELLSDIYFTGTSSDWAGIRRYWQECASNTLRYAAVHLSDGTIEQDIYHEDETFHYIENGGFGSQESIPNSYTCDLSPLFDNSYNYHHDLAKVSIRAAMAAMSTEGGTNSGNIEEMMNDLNISNRVIHYPNPSYNSIGYAMGTRRIYHNNEKKTLIMVAIRGGGYGAEWGGNANVGSGMNHEGFDLAAKQVYVALNQYIGELKADEFTDGSDIVVWISGYSRGAATANLLAAKLSDDNLASGVLAEYNVTEDHISAVKNINVHAFCFECPQNTTDANSNSLKYANIVNIINPKDFVTYVAMNNGWDWKFRRYGKDYVLPDEANTNYMDYAGYELDMELAYAGDTVPEIEMGQSVLVKDAARRLGNIIERMLYTTVYQEKIQIILAKTFPNDFDLEKVLHEIASVEILKLDIISYELSTLALEIGIVNSGIKYAHYPEICMAWMDSISEDILKKQKSFWNVFVNCPVDIYVYEGEVLVGCIKSDIPQKIQNGVITMLDSGGQKRIVLPADSKYKLVYKATADGMMTVSTSKYIQAESVPEMVTSYYELPLKAGTLYESLTTETEFRMTNSSGVIITPSVVQSGADVKFYKVDLSVEGNGEVTGVNTYSIGEFAKVTAHPLENEKFLGWYENGKFVSGEVEYRFCVKKDTNLVAKFTQNCYESKNDEKNVSDEKVSTGSRYVIKKHTYEVTSVTKKTVTFVKTASKSKTITIPSHVTINEAEYKVTAIAARAMKGNKKVTKITIGNNVTSIGASAFSGCKKLQKVIIGKGVTKIGKKAFYNCKKLKTITIKSTKLKSVGQYAFKKIASRATIKCPHKKLKKYKKIIKKSKARSTVRFK